MVLLTLLDTSTRIRFVCKAKKEVALKIFNISLQSVVMVWWHRLRVLLVYVKTNSTCSLTLVSLLDPYWCKVLKMTHKYIARLFHLICVGQVVMAVSTLEHLKQVRCTVLAKAECKQLELTMTSFGLLRFKQQRLDLV